MKFAVAPQLLAACLLGNVCTSNADSGTVSDHPIGKVIKLIEGLQEQVTEEGKTEALGHEKFEYWCKNSLKTLSAAIAKGEQETAKITSNIEAKKMQEKALQGEIKQLRAELDQLDAQGRKADSAREKTANLYQNASTDLKATIQAMESAITALEDSKPPGSLLAVDNSISPVLLQSPQVRRAVARLQASADGDSTRSSDLAEFLALAAGSAPRPELKARGDQAKHVQPYKFKSGNVTELLKSLKLSFEDDLVAATEAETNSINEYELAKQARGEVVGSSTEAKTEKELTLGEVQGDIAQSEADLKSASGDLAADQQTEVETQKTCTRRAREWDERCAVRDEELKAMAAAINILDKAGGVRTAAPTNPVPPPAPAEASEAIAFLQIVSPREKALDLLRTAARSTHSKALERLVAELTLRPNSPFDQVNNMIQKMIFRLMDEQKQEDKHKNWCDQELSKTNASEVDKTDKVEELTGKLDVAKARVQKLTSEIHAADKMVADLTSFMKEATEVREIGKKENAVALKDAQDAQAAIADATAVLEDFYKKSGLIDKEPYEFVQRGAAPVELEDPVPPMPEYKGTPRGTDIIALLGTTASEFAKMEADTRAQEATDQEDFEGEMKASKIEKARRAKESEMKAIEKKSLADKIAMLEKNRKHVQGEVDMVKQYLQDLQPACVEGTSSYEDRKAARLQEADALRQAQGILTDAFKEKEGRTPSAKFLEVRRHAAVLP